ncbi:DUF6382 domain-containing protein [Paenibacillus thermotolerans]|uniref:DUF6382 domain-containing protein n=1 Tax=Paenibacillus thermotolerans TaxID=3027807 RepID=UPI0023688B47|nr:MULTISPECIES: DUF6382 domain-containing protein [unclassified Paenibacillus]
MKLPFEELYQITYVQENGPKLLMGLKEGFSPQRVIPSQLGMLQANSIRGLIPFQAEKVDGKYRFRYDLSGLRKFEPVLRNSTMRDEAIRGWLLQLFLLIESHKQYLLDEEGFLIHPDYIWIAKGSDLHEVYLLYVPLRPERKESVQWRNWNDLYAALIRCGVSKAALCDLEPGIWEPESFSFQQLVEVLDAPAASTISEERDPKLDIVEGKLDVEREAPLTDDGETMRFQKPQLLDIRKLWIVFGTVCLLAFLATWEWIWLIGSLFSSVPIFIKGKRLTILTSRKRTGKETSGEMTDFVSSGMPEHGSDVEAKHALETEPKFLEPPLVERTTWLAPKTDETMLLSSGGNGSDRKEAWLEVRSDGKSDVKMISLADEPLLVGRGPQGVHLLVEQPGVSRVHLEIRKLDEGYGALDVGSMNGTYYNEEPMIAFRPYPLKPGDTLRLPGAQLLFRDM